MTNEARRAIDRIKENALSNVYGQMSCDWYGRAAALRGVDNELADICGNAARCLESIQLHMNKKVER